MLIKFSQKVIIEIIDVIYELSYINEIALFRSKEAAGGCSGEAIQDIRADSGPEDIDVVFYVHHGGVDHPKGSQDGPSVQSYFSPSLQPTPVVFTMFLQPPRIIPLETERIERFPGHLVYQV